MPTILLAILLWQTISVIGNKPPNIILIMADDLGWNDVGFHGSPQIPTPNIDALAYSGIILNNYYVLPICTPSRSALMTGKHPIHTGMQHTVLFGAEPRGLPLTEKLLPQYLKEIGYVTRLVGKWHLGSYKKEYTPTFRGFDSHLGLWTGHHDYYDHTAGEPPYWGLDMRRNLNVAYDLHGQYSTDIFTHEAESIIINHNTSKPLFLNLAHIAVHSGNWYDPLRAPLNAIKKFSHIKDYRRRLFAAMVSKLDDSVGTVMKALQKKCMLANSIIIFTTDNGGPAAGFNQNVASNYPLRGTKNTLWEGGIRGVGILWSTLLRNTSRVSNQMMHITDWVPTILEAVGSSHIVRPIDGVSLWNALSHDLPSPRKMILHNIDDIYGNAALRIGQFKFLKGTTYGGSWDSWYGPSGLEFEYSVNAVLESQTAFALRSVGKALNVKQILQLRNKATVECKNEPVVPCKPLEMVCLFNIETDPCEKVNLAYELPMLVKMMQDKMKKLNQTAVRPGNLPLAYKGLPQYHNYTWGEF